MITRRGLLRGAAATLIAAPAIVRAASLMALPARAVTFTASDVFKLQREWMERVCNPVLVDLGAFGLGISKVAIGPGGLLFEHVPLMAVRPAWELAQREQEKRALLG